MKLYAFQPTGHGPQSYFVMAESEELARAAIEKYILTGDYPDLINEWRNGNQELKVLAANEVAENDNG